MLRELFRGPELLDFGSRPHESGNFMMTREMILVWARRAAVPVNKRECVGEFYVVFDGFYLQAGGYFCKLAGVGFVSSNRIHLLKQALNQSV